MMDARKIIIVNLSKGRIGESNANLLGSMIITKLYLSAMSRADVPANILAKLPSFYLYVDEFQSFANESFADILSEARKYKLALTIAHQYIEQMPEEVRAAVFGNVGTTICFRVGPFDAEILEKIFFPDFTKEDLVNLGRFQMYLTLMIDGVGSPPFSAVTIPPIVQLGPSFKEEIIRRSRAKFSRSRAEVEQAVKELHALLTQDRLPETRPSPPAPAKTPAPNRPFNQTPARVHIPHVINAKIPSPNRISLSSLAPKKRPDTEVSKADLKAVLDRALNKKSPAAPAPSSTPPPVSSSKPKKPKEVPEDVLKKMLEV